MMTPADSLRVDLGERSYDIFVGEDLLRNTGKYVREVLGAGAFWIVTDENVAPYYLDLVSRSLRENGFNVNEIVLPAGEASKSFDTIEIVVNTVLEGTPERGSTLGALGGGVVGDIAGFAASQILRGINFVQIPTTLLAQVDSSVGGKTGINTPHGKNLAGAFYQPRLVLADTAALDTLPKRELLAGYAEIVKYGLIRDVEFFTWLEQNGRTVLEGNREARQYAVKSSCAAKASIVAEDEFENGVRALLNFGHTFGHALEAETGFGSELLHGEAVAIGMIMALDLSVRMGFCPMGDLKRTIAHFVDTGLPISVPSKGTRQWNPDTLINHMRHDKKLRDGQITFILAQAIGNAFIARDVGLDAVKDMLAQATMI